MTQSFDWKRLYALGKKVLIWGIFFFLLYVLSELFALIFFTYILAFITFRLSGYLVDHLRVTRQFAITVIYLLLVATISWLGYVTVPRIGGEARQFAENLPQLESKIARTVNDWRIRYPEFSPLLDEYAQPQQLESTLRKYSVQAGQALLRLIKAVLTGLMTVALSILFSFLIVLDLSRLSRDLKRLSDTRFRDFFQETAKPIVTFAEIVGRAFEAQMFIAFINTSLTLVGMLVLGIPKVALLSIIVFLCSFVPVLGVLISSVPIVLVAFNAAGIGLAIVALIMIVLVHQLEAYVVNPRIYARHMRMNPVVVLISLFLGNHFFGVWGVLLAVPVTHYFITHVAGLKMLDHEHPHGPGTGSGERTLPPSEGPEDTLEASGLRKPSPGSSAR